MHQDSPSPIRVLIVDDHAVVRAGLRMLIDSQCPMKVVADAGTRAEAVQAAAREQPDIVLLDLDMGSESGLSFLPDLVDAARGARILVLTGLRDPEAHRKAIRAGAKGVVFKEKAVEVLIKAIDKVHSGEVWLDRALASSLLDELSHPNAAIEGDPQAARIATLTTREKEIIGVVAQGLRNKEIADQLFITDVTVRHHLTSIYSKLGVADRFELAVYAFRHGLARPPG
jgi:two-component system nitrate/nitrite response regulator NarL